MASKLHLWQIDAFAEKPFEGNPAAVVPLERWPDDALLQAIAAENNLAETAYFVEQGPGRYRLRWFTPTVEVPLCGHATLASSWLIFNLLAPSLDRVAFETHSGVLDVVRGEGGTITMSLPADTVHAHPDATALAGMIGRALGTAVPTAVYQGKNVLAVFANPADVRRIGGAGDIARVLDADYGLIVTAPGDEGFDFVSRFFAPHHGIPEDPVTGSAHCTLAPYWADRLGKTTLRARQVSPRGGNVVCTLDGNRTLLTGTGALYMTGEIAV